ncbi:hypothetical protein [Burkholderia pseudomallei]|uniref:hypothetical protein n=1 Tax=Burkholderia pseudomallei TaxID=28450 RepID=UPI0013F16AFF|nr:hypothetical protein [Burkholderia pseudomallei]
MQPASDGRSLPRRAPRRIARAEADTHPANHIARHRGGAAMRPPRKTIGEHADKRPIDARQRGAAHRALARRHGPSQTIVRQRRRSSRKSIAELDAPRPGNRPKEAVVTGATPGAAAAVQFRARAAPTDCDARRPVQPRRAAANHALTAPATHASPLVTMPARPLAAFAPAPCPERSQCFACAIAIRIAPPSDMPSLKNASAISAALSRTQGIRLHIGAG